MSDHKEAVQLAERAIADILAKLEVHTDALVDGIEIVSHEITQVDDDRQKFLRRVSIKLRRTPGSTWAT